MWNWVLTECDVDADVRTDAVGCRAEAKDVAPACGFVVGFSPDYMAGQRRASNNGVANLWPKTSPKDFRLVTR